MGISDGVATRVPPTGSKSIPVTKKIDLNKLTLDELEAKHAKLRDHVEVVRGRAEAHKKEIEELSRKGGKDNLDKIRELSKQRSKLFHEVDATLVRAGKYSTHIDARKVGLIFLILLSCTVITVYQAKGS